MYIYINHYIYNIIFSDPLPIPAGESIKLPETNMSPAVDSISQKQLITNEAAAPPSPSRDWPVAKIEPRPDRRVGELLMNLYFLRDWCIFI